MGITMTFTVIDYYQKALRYRNLYVEREIYMSIFDLTIHTLWKMASMEWRGEQGKRDKDQDRWWFGGWVDGEIAKLYPLLASFYAIVSRDLNRTPSNSKQFFFLFFNQQNSYSAAYNVPAWFY